MTVVCLQGGAEFGPRCDEVDAHLLDLAGGGPVVVLPLASGPADHDVAGANGAAHFRRLGATGVAVAPPDPAPARALVEHAALVVLPGGSPSRLARALPPLAEAIGSRPVVSGASAGAMLLCGWTLLPEEGMRAVAGLGLAPGLLVLPHWAGGHEDWIAAARRQVPPDVDLLGLPECTGVVLDGDRLYALGPEPPVLLTAEGERLVIALGARPG